MSPGTRHPTPENIPEAYPPGLVLRESRTTPAVVNMLEEGLHADSVVLGLLEGEHHEMFGHVADVATDHLESLYILDSQYKEVRVYDFGGDFLSSFGGPGEGPGEFRLPREVAASGPFVTVAEPLRLHVFERQASGFVLKDTFNKDAMGRDGNCVMNGHLYTAGYDPESDHFVQKLTPDGVRVASFFGLYPTANTTLKAMMARETRLACSARDGILAVVPNNIPALSAYTEDGHLIWRARLADFRLATMEEVLDTETGRAMVRQGVEGILHTLFWDGADHFYLGYYTESEGGKDFAHHVFRVDVRTGRGEHLGTGRFSAASHGLVFLATNYSFPRVIAYQRGRAE